MSDGTSDGPRSSPPSDGRFVPRRSRIFDRMASVGVSAQAAIPGIYAWAITVAPAAWARGAPFVAKLAALVGVLSLVTAPLMERKVQSPSDHEVTGDAPRLTSSSTGASRASPLAFVRSLVGASSVRAWSVWGFVLSSALVWALVPSALSAARLDGVRGALGMVGWALFAFASAGPALRSEARAAESIVSSTSLKPRSKLPRGDGVYITLGVAFAMALQAIGWDVDVPERAVLVRLVTVACGIAVLGGMSKIALARHRGAPRPSRRHRLRRALPWLIMLALFVASAVLVEMVR